ncbi:MAG: hypothetical protein ACU826_12645 [Gammaproteobacteria bacterium]
MALEKLVWKDSMMVSAVILIVTFPGLFTATQHGPHRTKFAMRGAGAMVFAGQIYGFYKPEPGDHAACGWEKVRWRW